MYRIFFIIFVSFVPIFSVYAVEDGTIGEALEMGFYSRIHAGMDSTADILRKKQLDTYTTFSGFGRLCRPPIQWLDKEPMDEKILNEVMAGGTSRLVQLMEKNNIFPQSNTNSLANLVSCLAETYRNMGQQAVRSEKSLSSAGMLGLYNDGDTENSEYDIMADIAKINSILFVGNIPYSGKKNTSRDSFAQLAAGGDVGSIFPERGTPGSDTPAQSLSELGIGSFCSTDTTAMPIDNISDDFRTELASVLEGGQPPLGGEGYGGQKADTQGTNREKDFFHTPPCSANFCIRVRIVPTTVNLLGGGKTYSIEGLLDKHTKIIEPIAGSNLSAQKMVRNSFKIPFLNIVLKNKVAGGKILVDTSPQRKKQYEKEYTQEEQEKEFEELRRCAYVSAGLPSDTLRANITGGVGYQIGTDTSAENIGSTLKNLSVSNPEDGALSECMPIALEQARSVYYNSLTTDLTELEVFTSSLVDMIDAALTEHKSLDTKKIQ